MRNKFIPYNGFALEGKALPLRSGDWDPVGFVWEEEGFSEKGLVFPTQKEAETHALRLGAMWVDQH